jgi:hypothetical protein
MTDKEKELALYCLKVSSDYHPEVCEECIKYPNCDHTIQDDVTETIIKALEQEPILDKIRAEIMAIGNWNTKSELPNGDLEKVLDIIDKYKAESEDKE